MILILKYRQNFDHIYFNLPIRHQCGATVIEFAAAIGSIKLMKLFLDRGANVNGDKVRFTIIIIIPLCLRVMEGTNHRFMHQADNSTEIISQIMVGQPCC
jgi:hypothetical protein